MHEPGRTRCLCGLCDPFSALGMDGVERLLACRRQDAHGIDDNVGALDGVPAWARDRANRRVLDVALATTGLPGEETARAVAAEIHRQEAAGRRVQLWTLDLDDDLAALAVGDLDTADAVAVLVPWIATTPEETRSASRSTAAGSAQ